MNWQPSSNLATLRQRAQLLDDIRSFFKKKNILEVDTPLLCQHTVTDQHIDSFAVNNRYLQTSPEYAMKRLLAAGSGSIFQICKAFRHDESGRLHNPEFTLLEWYHVGFNHHDLMDEIDELLCLILKTDAADRLTYQDLFEKYCQLDPLNCDLETLKTRIENTNTDTLDRDTCLQLLFSQKIEPQLGLDKPTFVYGFPASQAALAKISKDNPLVAERFEVFIHGMEIANGFHELTDADEQLSRFKKDQNNRGNAGKVGPEIDMRFIDALKNGLPDCAGVALGIDRLMLCLTNNNAIKDVIAFDWDAA